MCVASLACVCVHVCACMCRVIIFSFPNNLVPKSLLLLHAAGIKECFSQCVTVCTCACVYVCVCAHCKKCGVTECPRGAIFSCFHGNSMGYHGNMKILLPWGILIHHIFYSACALCIAMCDSVCMHEYVHVRASSIVGEGGVHGKLPPQTTELPPPAIKVIECKCPWGSQASE